jgi:hypothetical protein
MGIEIVQRRRRDFDIVTQGSPAATRSNSILLASSGTSMTAAVRRGDARPVHPCRRHAGPGRQIERTRIGSCEIERSSASEPCATSCPRFMIRTCSARSSSSLSACEEIRTGGAVVAQFVQDFVKGLAQRRLEPRGRLVQQQHARPPQQRLGQAQTLRMPLE